MLFQVNLVINRHICYTGKMFNTTIPQKRLLRFQRAAALILILPLLNGCDSSAVKDAIPLPSFANESIEAGMDAIESRDYDSALKFFKEAENRHGNKELILRGKGLAQMGLTDYKAAIKSFEAALKESKGRVRNLEYDRSLYLAISEYRSGDSKSAIKTLDSILDLDSKNSYAYFLRGKIALGEGDSEKAFNDFIDAVKYTKDDPDLYIDIYECLESKGFADDGKDYLTSAMELTRLTNFQKGRIYYWMGDMESAKSSLETAKETDSNPKVILYLGKTCQALDDRAKAASCYSEYLESNPGDVNVCNELGLCQMEDKDYKGALSSFELGLKVKDNEISQTLRFNQIVAYEYLGEFEKAAELMEDYIEDYPSDAEASREAVFLASRRNSPETEEEELAEPDS